MYEFPVSQTLDGYVEGNWYYRSEVNFNVNHDPNAELDGINVMGFSAGLRSLNGWSLSLFCKNCNDEAVPNFLAADAGDAGDADAGISSYTQGWGFNSVRTVGINLRYDF